jgi:hypothetical protein
MAENKGGSMMPWERAEQLRKDYEEAREAMEALGPQIDRAVEVANAQKTEHASTIEEFNAGQEYLRSIEERITQVHNIIGRYAGVEDPVVASDGFTYERRTILAYFEECDRSGVEPQSNQAEVTLTKELMPNSTLRRIVDQVRAVRAPGEPAPAPPQAPRVPSNPAPPVPQPSAPVRAAYPPPPPSYQASAVRPPQQQGMPGGYQQQQAWPPQYRMPQQQQQPPAARQDGWTYFPQ